jgi:protein O-GlcNAc transferase
MDLFISNEWDEIESAQDHYSEKLVLLKNRAVFYMPSRVPSNNVTRDYFSLPADAHIYLCPMSPYKFHPEFDSILGEILERDPLAQIVIVNHETYKFLYKAVLERLNRTIPNVINRIRIVPRQSVSDFLQLLRLSDVLLDTIHFGGGTTCLESMLVGTPVISMPGEFLRSRGTQAFYKQMGITENLASNREEYIQMALRMAEDRDLNQSLRSTILEHNHVLYEDLSGVKDLEQFFLGLANRI